MRYEKNSNSRCRKLVDLAHAALAEVDISHRERFVHQKDFGIEMDRDCEGKANNHTAGVGFDRLVNEVADFGEGLDVGKPAVHILGGKTEDRSIEIDIVRPENSGLNPEPSSSSAATRPLTIDGPRVG